MATATCGEPDGGLTSLNENTKSGITSQDKLTYMNMGLLFTVESYVGLVELSEDVLHAILFTAGVFLREVKGINGDQP